MISALHYPSRWPTVGFTAVVVALSKWPCHRDELSSPTLTVVLRDGNEMPVIGFGSGGRTNSTLASRYRAVSNAIAAGMRHVDTAQAYGNAEAVLGRQLPAAHQFRVVSKLPAQTKSEFNSQDTDAWEKEPLRRSLVPYLDTIVQP